MAWVQQANKLNKGSTKTFHCTPLSSFTMLICRILGDNQTNGSPRETKGGGYHPMRPCKSLSTPMTLF